MDPQTDNLSPSTKKARAIVQEDGAGERKRGRGGGEKGGEGSRSRDSGSEGVGKVGVSRWNEAWASLLKGEGVR